MTRTWTILILCLVVASAQAETHCLRIKTAGFDATLTDGCLSMLKAPNHACLVGPNGSSAGLTIHHLLAASQASHTEGPATSSIAERVRLRHTQFGGLKDAEAQSLLRIDHESGDMIVEQTCSSQTAGIWGLGWSIGRIPLQYAVIVPGHSGLRLTADMPERRMQFDYPRSWEAQFVIVEGRAHGFYVWADDTSGRYKRLVVERHPDGWQLTLITENDAPFDGLESCRSVPWHVNVYEGDWRVPARRYREWAVAHFEPVPIDQQKPAWVGNIRAMVITGLDRAELDVLAKRLDAAQTVLYVPSWRAAGYDRDYPTYDEAVDELGPFIERAHVLGFRVMLHVNYFGVDPTNALYERFERFQVRDCFGTHERLWWLWTRAEPEIRFAYINPALKAWRDLFTERMIKLCRTYDVDALHLDQTLCIDNDHNGRIEGLSMLEGNLALHRQLREALPEVALSGEGLNEVTYRYEAFAQRHAYGLNHAEGTWDRRRLALAHPISSYLFCPYTIINGYLGCAPPSQGQLYAAWNDAYEHWGVIPTLKPQGVDFSAPQGFARQFFDEVQYWQKHRLQIDLDGDWPETTAFPWRTADGRKAERTADGRLTCEAETISRTITGVSSGETDGTISGWRAYDEERVFGLDPDCWYPVFSERRTGDEFHISRMPDRMIATTVAPMADLAMIRTRSRVSVVADLVDLLDTAVAGSRPFHGMGYQQRAPLAGDDGARIDRLAGDRLFAHPPWKARQTSPQTGDPDSHGTGIAFVRYQLDLPAGGQLRFLSDVALQSAAVGEGRSDGVTFRVTARAGIEELSAEVGQASDSSEPLSLELTELAGQRIDLELTVHPGPKGSPSFDWSTWIRPRIEMDESARDQLSVTGGEPWSMAIDGDGAGKLVNDGGTQSVATWFPGTVFLLRKQPELVRLPCELAAARREVCFLDERGHNWTSPGTAGVHVVECVVGGVRSGGIFAHPPDGGQTVVQFPLQLPDEAAVFRTKVGLRDGSQSTGVRFLVQINGRQVAERRVLPGQWHELEVQLADWRGRPIVLSLVTDSDGSYYFDWAQWGQPRVEATER
jgi:hypothetical protein